MSKVDIDDMIIGTLGRKQDWMFRLKMLFSRQPHMFVYTRDTSGERIIMATVPGHRQAVFDIIDATTARAFETGRNFGKIEAARAHQEEHAHDSSSPR